MKPKIERDKGWIEVIIDDDCEYAKFYRVADILQTNFAVTFTNKINDLDSLYWDFEYNTSKLTLHYNVYMGISLFPTALADATEQDNSMVLQLGDLLFNAIIEKGWYAFDDGKSIGSKGSEQGNIIMDIEHIDGARITLEKDTSIAPFAITMGIYGLMFHTDYKSDLSAAEVYIVRTKYLISKVFDLHDITDDKRDEHWHSKLNKLSHQIAGLS